MTQLLQVTVEELAEFNRLYSETSMSYSACVSGVVPYGVYTSALAAEKAYVQKLAESKGISEKELYKIFFENNL